MDEATSTSAMRPRTITADLAARPEATWLDQVEREIDDVDVVLRCLSQPDVCATCQALVGQGLIEARPVLARCAGSKQSG